MLNMLIYMSIQSTALHAFTRDVVTMALCSLCADMLLDLNDSKFPGQMLLIGIFFSSPSMLKIGVLSKKESHSFSSNKVKN